MKLRFIYILFILVCFNLPLSAQLPIGNVASEINFREGPGTNYNVIHTLNNSNLLVILPREPQNGFVEAFDVETSKRGYIYESLIQITDTLFYQSQKYFEKSGANDHGDIEIVLNNKTKHALFVWINKISYDVSPYERKVLVLDVEDVIYFSSAPGLFPIFGKEVLQKGNTYMWNFSL